MKNTFLILTFLTVCFLGNKVSGQTVTPLTTAEFKEKIWNFETDKDWKYKGDKPAIIDMYATWCGPCKRLAPILEEIQKDYGQKLQIYKVDTDKRNPTLPFIQCIQYSFDGIYSCKRQTVSGKRIASERATGADYKRKFNTGNNP